MKETYRALTRSYRPQKFEDIVAQDHVSSTLLNAIKNNRLSHAYMFCGPRGVGKTTMARVLARAVNQVDEGVDGEALGNTLNIVEMDAASNRKIEDVRSLKEVIRVPPQNGRYKIFIIDEVHMLTKEAFNALLKTLEEPPEHAIFIFATTEPHKVLPTILSRVQRFDFKRISVDEIVGRLRLIAERESIEMDEESLHVIAKRADGALRDALGLMDQAIAFCGDRIEHSELLRALNVVGVEDLFSFTESVAAKDADRGLTLIRELVSAGVDIQEYLVSLTEHIRNLYVAVQSRRLVLIEETEETKKRYVEHAGEFDEEDLIRMLHLVSETQHRLRDARQPRVQFEILMLKLIHMGRARDLNTLIGELQELKKKPGNGELKSEYSDADRAPGGEGLQPAGDELESSTLPEKREGGSVETGTLEGVVSPGDSNGDDSGEVAEQLQKEPEEEELFGRPSLGSLPGGKVNREVHAENRQVADSRPETGRIKSLEELVGRWEDCLEELKNSAPRTLYFQMQRVELVSLSGSELTVKADNEFARQLLDENQQLLFRILKRILGKGLKICCKVERGDTPQQTLSPYERFKKLQQKDPHIRTLVELFGAELEY